MEPCCKSLLVIAYENPKLSGAWNEKGNAFFDRKLFKDALFCYDMALKLEPTYAGFYINKGNTYNELKMFDDALKLYENALKIDPDNETTKKLKEEILSKME
ncbi:tetratricopeptide repeat protein [Methanobacterium alcaliphilum]|uniref:tetratricopeptide repeat protein n=1 Tax=Methanobacterium alcaliphilum TaxID=392018 RepID=UPI00200B0626|nr:tetratricopeptide repeat protein [Methanobacterium alcaliphilum]MCK9151833.1 tetratricopeptide repeat protein [Methanobacterium alcaliphilum]